MGDILGAILGTSSTQDQTTTPDPVARALNQERLNQLYNFFQTAGPMFQFAGENPALTQPTDFTTDISSFAHNSLLNPRYNPDFTNIPSFEDYKSSFGPTADAYGTSVANLDRLTQAGQTGVANDYNTARSNMLSSLNPAFTRSYADYNTGINSANSTYGQVSGDITADYNAAIARGDYDYARALTQNESARTNALGRSDTDFANALGLTEANYGRNLSGLQSDITSSLGLRSLARDRALQLGTDATDNYMSRIAIPRINQAMTLQGLESGGAVPQAIATATASTAIPYLQSIEQAYGSDVANLLANYMAQHTGLGTATQSLEAGLGGQQAAQSAAINEAASQRAASLGQSQAQGNLAAGTQLMSLQGAAGNTYQNNINQLAQALMANNITLDQAGISAESALGQQLVQAQNALRLNQQQGGVNLATSFMPLSAAFAQSVPQVGSQLAALPGQLQAQQASNLTALSPIADYPRQLQQQDYLRRQGLFTSMYTGIPFQPGSSTTQDSATGNLFNQVGGLLTSFGTGGTKGGSA